MKNFGRNTLATLKANFFGLNTSSITEPVVAEPVVAEPIVAEPIAAEPVAAEPITAEPIAAEPIAAEPIVAEPVVAEPIAAEPVVAQFAQISVSDLNQLRTDAGKWKSNESEFKVLKDWHSNMVSAGAGLQIDAADANVTSFKVSKATQIAIDAADKRKKK